MSLIAYQVSSCGPTLYGNQIIGRPYSDPPCISTSTPNDDAIGILRLRLVDDGETVTASLAAD